MGVDVVSRREGTRIVAVAVGVIYIHNDTSVVVQLCLAVVDAEQLILQLKFRSDIVGGIDVL